MTTYTRRPLFRRGGQSSSYWRGRIWDGSVSDPDIPELALLTEDGEPILTEAGEFILVES